MKQLLLFITLFWVYIVKGQSPEFEKLKLTSSPAFVILGVEPENITRPNTPTEFVTGLQSAVVNGKIQPNLAMEFTPYLWIKKDKDPKRFNPYELINGNAKNKSEWGKLFLKSLTFSIATSESDTFTFGSIKKGTGIAGGVRFLLAPGKVSPKIKKLIESAYDKSILANFYSNIIAGLKGNDDVKSKKDAIEIVETEVENWDNLILNQPSYASTNHNLAMLNIKLELPYIFGILNNYNEGKVIKKLEDRKKVLDTMQTKNLNEVNSHKFPLAREGFMLEVAIAGVGIFQENNWKNYKHAKVGIWITPSYRINLQKNDKDKIMNLDLMCVGRVIFNSSPVENTHYFDVGGKLQYLYNKLTLSTEFVARYLTNKPDGVKSPWTWRATINGDYKINDYITITAAFGSNFDGNTTHYDDPKKIFAVGGLNLGFGQMLKQ